MVFIFCDEYGILALQQNFRLFFIALFLVGMSYLTKSTVNFSWKEMLIVYYLTNYGGAGILSGQAT